MSNVQRKLAFTVSKSTTNNAEYNSKDALPVVKHDQQSNKKREPSTTKSKSSTSCKRKRKTTTETKNHSITQFFTLSSPANLASPCTVTNESVTSPSISDEENITCRIRSTHPVQEIWNVIIDEYGEAIDEHIRVKIMKISLYIRGKSTDALNQESTAENGRPSHGKHSERLFRRYGPAGTMPDDSTGVYRLLQTNYG
ncbi:hypothetical protein BJV82DRAFT_594490 [Fennellomyces sp. T-0311]|nr:hypothetical protein BJV82DRAFT_594490 [Fennellomyces sp. T-0311]